MFQNWHLSSQANYTDFIPNLYVIKDKILSIFKHRKLILIYSFLWVSAYCTDLFIYLFSRGKKNIDSDGFILYMC